MKFTAKRLLAAGAIGVSAIITPLSLTVALSGVGSAPSSVAGAASFDQILFNQPSSPPDTYQYVPAVGQASQPQPVNMSGNCATPTDGSAAILAVCGELYSSLTYVGGSITPANLGSNGQFTGVASVSPAWTIENKSNKGAEAIDFSPGPNAQAVIGSNRVFKEANIPITRKDTGVSTNPFLIVQLAELDSSGHVLATQNCTLTGNTGTTINVDTNNAGTVGNPPTGPGNCAPSLQGAGGLVPTPPSFQTVEVRDLTTSTSISVGPNTATFTLATVICGGQSINATNGGGNVVASLSLPNGAGCKTFNSFISTTQPNGKPLLTFDGFSASPVQFTVQITWPLEPLCQPYSDPFNAQTNPSGIPPDLANPVCPFHQVSFDNVTYYDQTYCQTANSSPPAGEPQAGLCTANKQYNNDSVSVDPMTGVVTTTPLTLNGAPATQIVETWVGDVDWGFR
jgi:hypothetical protein